MGDIDLSDIIEAYFDCRKNKRTKPDAIAFEINWESNCIELHESILSRKYRPMPSIALMVNKPVKREIMASAFRDRIVHHFISLRLEPLFEAAFIEETTNCRKGKGTSYGIKLLKESIRKVSDNYTSDCWVLKLDIKSFFMSINKRLLLEKLLEFIDQSYRKKDIDTLKYLIEVTLMNDPTKNCVFRSPKSAWHGLPKDKSLFSCPPGFGLAPGNLTSQQEANFFLNDFDHWAKGLCEHYGRYVDDFYFVDKSRERLRSFIPLIKNKLKEIGLTLHPNKIYLQHYTKGVKYIGAVLKADRSYISNRTVGNLFSAIHRFNLLADKEGYIENNANHFVAIMNSYLGLCKQFMSYNIRRKAVKRIDSRWWKVFYVSGHFEKLVLNRKYQNGLIIKE